MVDYGKIDKLVENCKILYPDMPDYILWVLACDYYIHEDNDEDEDEERTLEFASAGKQTNEKEALEAFLKAQEELKATKYKNIKVV